MNVCLNKGPCYTSAALATLIPQWAEKPIKDFGWVAIETKSVVIQMLCMDRREAWVIEKQAMGQ